MRWQVLKVLAYLTNNMKKELELFWIALMFYTRIPIPFKIEYSDDKLNKATRYFPLIGYVVGALSFITFYLLQFVLPLELSVIGSLVVGMLTTGAFHEDGLADFFDGFGGGWTKDKILDIMKDSRVGTYGMVATIIQLAIKYYGLIFLIPIFTQFGILAVFILFVGYHAFARLAAISLSFVLDSVRDDEKSKAKPIAKKQTKKELFWVCFFGLIPLFLICSYSVYFIFSIVPIFFVLLYFKNFLFKWIGGYTGDCLGAVEQICEAIFLISLLAIWNFIS